jgi:pimeloyl-ACP methyl ester carboxylesterase
VATTQPETRSGLRIEVHGEGPALLVPGLHEEFEAGERLNRAFVDSLANRYRVVLVHVPSAPNPATYTPEGLARDIIAVADSAGADEFVWFGYSWTGVAGLQLALRTDRLAGLICGGFPPIDGPYRKLLALVEANIERGAIGAEVADELAQPVSAAQARAIYEPFRTLYLDLQDFDDHAAQASITCPRLCFVGSEDVFDDISLVGPVVEHRAELERLGWEVQIVDGLDHMGVLEPNVVVPIVADWLDREIAQ